MEVIFSVPEPTRRSCQRPRRAGDCVLAELGEGIRATCRIAKPARQEHSESDQPGGDKPDVKSLSSMLAALEGWLCRRIVHGAGSPCGPGPRFSNHDS